MKLDAIASAPIVLNTRRLLLRPASRADASDIASYRGLEDVCRYVPFAPMSAADVVEKIDTRWNRRDTEGGNIVLSVVLREQDAVIGDIILFWKASEQNDAEIGWVFSPHHAGHGFATEAVRAVIGFAFRELKLRRIVAKVDNRNERSLALCNRIPMRQEASFTESRIFKGDWITEVHFGLLGREWTTVDQVN